MSIGRDVILLFARSRTVLYTTGPVRQALLFIKGCLAIVGMTNDSSFSSASIGSPSRLLMKCDCRRSGEVSYVGDNDC